MARRLYPSGPGAQGGFASASKALLLGPRPTMSLTDARRTDVQDYAASRRSVDMTARFSMPYQEPRVVEGMGLSEVWSKYL